MRKKIFYGTLLGVSLLGLSNVVTNSVSADDAKFDVNLVNDINDKELTVIEVFSISDKAPKYFSQFKLVDRNGQSVTFDGKEINFKPKSEGLNTLTIKTKRGIYKVVVDVKDDKAILYKAPQLVSNSDDTSAVKPTRGWYQQKNGKWQYFYKGQPLKYGWASIEYKWYYLTSNGDMVKGWLKLDNNWYYFNNGGVMQTGWVKDSGKWYYLNSDGSMATGWIKDGDDWYYTKHDGSMLLNQWFDINGKWYYVTSNGSLAVNTVIDGYYVNYNGEWIR
jgi:surface protein pspA